jgi:hypothetical protein
MNNFLLCATDGAPLEREIEETYSINIALLRSALHSSGVQKAALVRSDEHRTSSTCEISLARVILIQI